MPSRPVLLGILGFWLAANGWLFYREVWPRLRPGQPPAYSIDLADEVRAEPISWDVFFNKQPAGTAVSSVAYDQPTGTFELRCDYTFHKDKGLDVAFLKVRKMTSALRVTRQGQLRQARADVKMVSGLLGSAEMKLQADVDNGLLTPRLEVRAGAGLWDQKLKFDPVPVSEGGSVLNPMHPLNKVTNLREGQHWRLPDVDPLKTAAAALGQQVTGQAFTFPSLVAEVRSTALAWDAKSVECWLIVYSEPGGKLTARTWVRKADDLVLQQEAHNERNEFVLLRVPPR
jgi:hypothetical protein